MKKNTTTKKPKIKKELRIEFSELSSQDLLISTSTYAKINELRDQALSIEKWIKGKNWMGKKWKFLETLKRTK